MKWTELPNVKADRKTEHVHTWPELVEYVRGAGPFPSKDRCPLLKLASFGTQRTNKHSLRHDANVLAVHGVEGDYDAQAVTMADALAALERHGIRAAVYPSPSWTAEKPRWRVIAPLATPCPPTERARMVARLNGALGGILADESFTLSQSFYFGRVNADWTVLCAFDDPTEGNCIDELPELDAIAIGKREAGPTHEGGERAPVDSTIFRERCAALGRKLRTGDGRRELLKTWIASRSARGQGLEDLKFSARGVAHMFFDPSDEPDWADIDKMAEDFTRKDYLPPVDTSGFVKVGNESQTLLKPVSVRDALSNPAAPPAFVWDGYLPRGTVSLFGAHGGTGKSTLALMLLVCAALGRPLFGVPTVRTKSLFVSLEDGENVVRHRLASICRAWGIDPAELHDLHIVDGTDNPELFASEGRAGGEPTATHGELCKLAEGCGLVVVDNASDAYGGDEIQRRQVRAFMRLLGGIAKRTDCAVVLLAHVDKTTSRNKRAEGGEGYSGSTAWHNSARSRLFLTRGDDGLLTLEHQKSNYGRMREPLALEWPDGGLPQLVQSAGIGSSGFASMRAGRDDDNRAAALLKLIAEFEGRGQYCSPIATARNNVHALLRSEPAFLGLKLRPDDTKRIVDQCQRAKWLEPLEYRTHDRKTRLRWTLTPDGRAFAGLAAPSAPCAPSSGESAEGAERAGGARLPRLPPRGVRGERERTQEGAEATP